MNQNPNQQNPLSEDNIYQTAAKISTVLQKFYSLHEADKLTRIITDPESDVEDIKACMEGIRQRNIQEEMLEHITNAWLSPGNDGKVFITAVIDNLVMPYKELNDTDARDMSGVDKGLLTEEEYTDMVKDLALSYYKEELTNPNCPLYKTTEEQKPELTKADLRTMDDLDKAMQQKYPEGLDLNITDLTADDVFSYVQYGFFRAEDFVFAGIGETVPESEYLKTEVRLPGEALHKLHPDMDTYCDEEYEDLINDLDMADVYHAGTSELMNTHPDLMGARFSMYGKEPAKYMHIEGQPLSTSIAWILQNPYLSTQQLKDVLTNPEKAQTMLDGLKTSELSEYDRDRIAKMNLPQGLDMKHNDNRMFFFEKGVLGYAEVDRMRGVTYTGETMSRESQDFINDFVANRNLNIGRTAFFAMPGVNSEQRAYLDTMNQKLVKVNVEKNLYGQVLHLNGSTVLTDAHMQHYQDITGRITNANIFGVDKPMVRCKIDGQQQMARPLDKLDIIRMGSYMYNSDAMKRFALSMAVKHFANDLYSISQEQAKGMKR